MVKRKRTRLNIQANGLVHAPDANTQYVLTCCFTFLTAPARNVRQPVTCVQCLAVQQAMGPRDDPWDARKKLGDEMASLWGRPRDA